MIPLGDLVPSRTRPVATLTLGAVSIAGSVALWASLGSASVPPARLGLSPAAWTWAGAVWSLTAYRGITACVACLLALWLFGPTVEDRLGPRRFVLLWLASGLSAVAGHIAVAPHATTLLLGGVGATAGVIAGNLALHPRGRVLAVTPVVVGFEFVDLPSWLYAGVWLSVIPLATLAPLPVILVTCATGAAAGATAALLLKHPERMRIEWWGR
ncbi:MAG: rhomboid family intramembrane serine protease [Vicinamibacterales bacterium]|nr:rhomboid family intramembrane serine protease [Vicinamibacterales bacterium]